MKRNTGTLTEADREGFIPMSRLISVRVLWDAVEDDDPTPAVEPGTVIEHAYIPSDDEYNAEPGEVWYQHPVSGEPWITLAGDYEVLNGGAL